MGEGIVLVVALRGELAGFETSYLHVAFHPATSSM